MSSWPAELRLKQRFVVSALFEKTNEKTTDSQDDFKVEVEMLNKVSFFFFFFLKEYLPADIQGHFSTCRELIRNIHNSFQKLRDRAEKMAERSKENASDLLMFGKELR